tara:strand:- start:2309 stop:3559 length:1251 start_codon:yes stop_codon:yes gene_type:complete
MSSNFQIKGQPLDVFFCKKCVYSNQKVVPSTILTDDKNHSNRKFLRFNEDGVCSACQTVEKKKSEKKDDIDWKEREFQLKKILEKYRSRNGSYDCIVPGSGGKDSVFQAYTLKNKYNMNPLTVTFAPIMYTQIGLKNFHNWPSIGNVNNFLYSPSGKVYGKLTRLAFERMLHPFQPFIFGQRHIASHLASQLNIPLIFNGEPFSEYGSEDKSEDINYSMPYKYYTKKKDQNILISGASQEELNKNFKISNSDLKYFLPLEEEEVMNKDIQVIFLGYFEKMNPQENFYKAAEISGFETSSERTEGTYSKYNSLDDKVDGFHYWTSYIKYGIGRTTEEASNECRHGYITREEAVNLVKKYDGEFPKKYFNDFLKLTELKEDKFYDIVDSFRPSHLWKKVGNDFKYAANWKLKNTVYKK